MDAVIYTCAITSYLLGPQLSICRAYAEAAGINVSLVLSDLDDGTSLDRPGLAALRARVAEQEFKAIILSDSFVLSRRLDEIAHLTREFEEAGLAVHVLAA